MHHMRRGHGGKGASGSVRQCVSSSVRQFVILSAMRARSAGRHYPWPNIVCVRVVNGLPYFAVRCMDLIPRAVHGVGRMRLKHGVGHLLGGATLGQAGSCLGLGQTSVQGGNLWRVIVGGINATIVSRVVEARVYKETATG